MLHYAAAVLVTSMVLAQAEAQDQKDDFEKLRGFLGTWEQIHEDGTRGIVQWAPILQGRFIERRYGLIDDTGNVPRWGIMIYGRDPSDSKVRGWAFHPMGGYASTGAALTRTTTELLEWQDNVSVWRTDFILSDGNSRTLDMDRFALVNENSYKRILPLEQGEVETVFTRISPEGITWSEPSTEIPEGVSEPMKELAWWAGHCTMEGTDAFTGKLFVGQSKCRWAMNGNFLLYDVSTVDNDLKLGQYRALIGVDPLTNKVTGWEFESTGTVGKYIVTDTGQEIVGEATSPDAGLLKFKGRMTKTPDGIDYQATGELPNDQQTSYHGISKRRK